MAALDLMIVVPSALLPPLPLPPSAAAAGAEADQWERGKPLPPMPGMQQGGGQQGGYRGGPPGMMGHGSRLHKTDSAYKVCARLTALGGGLWGGLCRGAVRGDPPLSAVLSWAEQCGGGTAPVHACLPALRCSD